MHFSAFVLLCYLPSVVSVSLPLATASATTADVTWDFSMGDEGWAKATSEEMNANVQYSNGELYIRVEGPDIHIDSPRMNHTIGPSQHFAFRYRFIGPSKAGKIRLRGGGMNNSEFVLDYGFIDWGGDDEYSNIQQKGLADIYFSIIGDGLWHIAYAKITWKDEAIVQSLHGIISQIRLWPGCRRESSNAQEFSEAPKRGNTFLIDWIRLVQPPIINRITGCYGEKYSTDSTFHDAQADVTSIVSGIDLGGNLSHHQTVWRRRESSSPYAMTYNCLRQGGERITLEGDYFGAGGVNGSGVQAHVYIDGKPCRHVEHDLQSPQTKLTCITPELDSQHFNDHLHIPLLLVKNGKLPGLIGSSRSFRYAVSPPRPRNITLSNFAARSIDISWIPGGTIWDQMTHTGFTIKWREYGYSTTWFDSIVTGNVTSTTIKGLGPNRLYEFGVAGLNENQESISWRSGLDVYGRRDMLHHAIVGPISIITGHTLSHDVYFDHFNANKTQDHGPENGNSGEGHYGLILVGNANIENCNSSSYCCDSYDEKIGSCIDDDSSYTCLSSDTSEIYPHNIDRSNKLDSIENILETGCLPGFGKMVQEGEVLFGLFPSSFGSRCGPALRLTSSHQKERGAAWYPRQLEVGEGFDTYFQFRISNPSFNFAFVIQADQPGALGLGGQNLGYGGIHNSLAIEFDTYFNYEQIDSYENHVSVHTRGWRYHNSANHTFSLAHTNAVPDLMDGVIQIRIKYEPYFNIDQLSKPTFQFSSYLTYFFEKSLGIKFGTNWNSPGLGLLYIYCRDENEPVLILPLNLDATLKLNQGRSWVGFTSATGEEAWQVHDILNWKFTSLRMDDSPEGILLK